MSKKKQWNESTKQQKNEVQHRCNLLYSEHSSTAVTKMQQK